MLLPLFWVVMELGFSFMLELYSFYVLHSISCNINIPRVKWVKVSVRSVKK